MYITILYNFFYIYSVNKQKIEIPSIKLTFIIIKKKTSKEVSTKRTHLYWFEKNTLFFFVWKFILKY